MKRALLVAIAFASPTLATLGRAPVAILSAPSTVEYGDPVPLDGRRSTVSPPAHLVRYSWTLMTPPGNSAFPANSPIDTKGSSFEVPSSASDPLPLGAQQFRLVVTDNLGNSSAPTYAQVIVRDTTAPTAVLNVPSTVEAGQSFTLDGRSSADTPPGNIAQYTWTLLTGSGNGAVRPNSPIVTTKPTFQVTASAADPFALGAHQFQLVVTDDSGNVSAPATAQVIVRDTTAPTAILDVPATVETGQNFTLDGSRSADPPPGQIAQYKWTLLSGTFNNSPLAISPVITSTPTFEVTASAADPIPPGVKQFQLVVTDDSGNVSAPATAQVIVRDTTAPTAILDVPATVETGQNFTLDGSRSADPPPGQVVQYRWTLLSGTFNNSALAISPVITSTPTFEVTASAADPIPPGVKQFQLVVTDDSGNVSAPATAQVIVRDTTAPTAILDVPATVETGQNFTLDGSRSADPPPGQVVQYRWTLLSGTFNNSALAISPVITSTPTFEVTASAADPIPPGVKQFQLVVTDDSGNVSAPAVAQVIVRDTTAPTAILDVPATVETGQNFTLDGSRSADPPPGQVVQYRWTLLSGTFNNSPLAISPVITSTPTFEVTASAADPIPPGVKQFQLVVTDDSGNVSAPAVAQVIVRDTTAPTAILDVPATVETGQNFTLDGSRSADPPPGQIAQYKWTLLSGTFNNSPLAISPVITSTPTFEVTASAADPIPPGVKQFQLVVTDDSGNVSAPAVAQVIVRDTTAPTAILDVPATVETGQNFTLDGSRSADPPPGQVVQYRWTLLSGSFNNSALAISPVITSTPTFEVTASAADPIPPGVKQFQLVVTDDSGNVSAPAVAQVIVRDTTAPTAILDVPATVETGQNFTLDGSRSADPPPGQIAQYKWTLLSGSFNNSPLAISPVITSTPTFEVTASAADPIPPGVKQFQLVVTDDSGNVSAPTVAQIVVLGSPILSIARISNSQNLEVSWPAAFSGRTLHRTENLAPPVLWTPVSESPVLRDGAYRVSVPPTPATLFFSLGH